MTPSLYELLDSYSNPPLVAMLKARGVFAKQTRKADMLAALLATLEDEAATRAAFEALAPPQQLLLHLLREKGGRCTVLDLKAAASLAGLLGFDDLLHQLMRRALVLFAEPGRVRHELWRAPGDTVYGWRGSSAFEVIGLPAALALAEAEAELEPPARTLRAFEGEPALVHEESPAALLHAVFTVARWAGEREVSLAKASGEVKKNDLRALESLLKERAEWSSFVLPLALAAGVLRLERGKLTVAKAAPAFFALPPRHQVARLYEAWLGLGSWSEFFRIPEIETDEPVISRASALRYGHSDVPTAEALPQARAVVVGVLKRAGISDEALGQWHSLASLLEVIEAEEPEFLIPSRRSQHYYSSSLRDDAYDGFWPRGQDRWRARFRKGADWPLVEGRFILQVLAEPLLWLGMVATARDASGQDAAFRLTPLGAHLLGLGAAPAEIADEAEEARPLIVQPNFEIIAYTEPRHLGVLYELERFADRESAERVAHYKLSRESVYRGLQDGLSAESMRQYLERHSRSGLPQNIAYSLGDWQSLFERTSIRRSATVLEADSPAELDALLAALPEGAATRLAPLWALIEPPHAEAARLALAKSSGSRALDYSVPIEQALRVTDGLQVVVPAAHLDLWLRARIEQFADALPREATEPSGEWRFEITRASLARAAALKVGCEDVLAFLHDVGAPLPANVALTLRGWGGALEPAFLGSLSALVVEPGLIAEIVAVEPLRALLWLKVDDRTALVRDADVPALRAALEARGLSLDAAPGAHLKPPRKPSPPAAPARSRPAHRGVELSSGLAPRVRPDIVSAHPGNDEVDLEEEPAPERLFELLRGAIGESRCVVIRYQGKVRLASRKVSPLELGSDSGHDYLHAWDHWRRDYRVFRLDRIEAIAVLDEVFDAAST